MARSQGWELDNLAAWRERRYMQPVELAEKSGIALSMLSRLEHGTQRAGPKTVNRLCEALGVSREQLLTETPVSPKEKAAA